jgi:hypothetical protein
MRRVLKLGVISLIVFTVVLTFISFFFPSHIRISKAIDITADSTEVINTVNDTATWRNWYPAYDSMNAHSRVWKHRSQTGWRVFESGQPNQVTVQWYIDFHLKWYPWEKFSSLLLEKRYGPMMERGLEKLKSYIETKK